MRTRNTRDPGKTEDVADLCFCATVSSIHALIEKKKNQGKGPHLEGDTTMERRGYQGKDRYMVRFVKRDRRKFFILRLASEQL